jgi:hypothetical protein
VWTCGLDSTDFGIEKKKVIFTKVSRFYLTPSSSIKRGRRKVQLSWLVITLAVASYFELRTYISNNWKQCSGKYFGSSEIRINEEFRILSYIKRNCEICTGLGPTQLPIRWVPGALSLEVKRPGSEADHSPPFSAEVKNAWSYTSAHPIHLHGVVLS